MNILLTNDDSVRSPLLRYIIAKLVQLGALTIVVPAEEQSWRGKSITRFEPVKLFERDVWGHKGYAVTGTPADCVNFGLYHLCPAQTDLVISGINAGHNTGVAFLWSSGTIGASLEGNIAGIPGIAISQHLDREAFRVYRDTFALPPQESERLHEQTALLLDKVFGLLLPRLIPRPELPITYNVNLPFHMHTDVKLEEVPVSKLIYRSLFAKTLDGFHHSLDSRTMQRLDKVRSDTDVLDAGHVSISKIDPWSLGQ